MLLALLIYCYSVGVRSSRQMERLCRTDVALRVISGLQVPDHTVIARFRQRHQDSVCELFTQVLLVCAKAGLGRLGTIAVDGTKIAANAAKKATCRRQWLQQQVDEIIAQAAAADAAEDAVVGSDERAGESPQRLWGRRERAERLKRALAEVIAEETERGWDEESAAAKHRAFIEATRAGRNDVGSRPVGADPVAVAEARLLAARTRLAEQIAVKREQIAAMRGRIRRYEAGEGAKPNLGPFSFDENRGREVARAKRWVARADRELAAARARTTSPSQSETADLTPVPGGGRHGPRGIKVKDKPPVARRNVTDPDSRLMQDSTGGIIQGYNAQLAVSSDGLILSPKLVQDRNDRQQLRPMSGAAVTAALLIHQARCQHQCPAQGGCCIVFSAGETAAQDAPHGCGHPACPCLADWIGTLLFDAGYWTQDNLTAPGPDRLIAPGKHHALPQTDPGALPENADPAARMIYRLATEEGAALYKRRSATIEPVNGHLKDRTALRRFARRGLTACQAELSFTAMVLNLGKLFRLQTAQRPAAPTT
jgi:hypothetical protein